LTIEMIKELKNKWGMTSSVNEMWGKIGGFNI
jgi:hypothetical protein